MHIVLDNYIPRSENTICVFITAPHSIVTLNVLIQTTQIIDQKGI